MRLTVLLLVCAGLGACQSSGDIAYVPTVSVVPGPPAVISGVSTQDVRGEKPNRLATVRGLYGNPSQVFDTTRLVSEEVSEVFTAALQARGMLAATAPYRMTVTLRKYYGETYFARRAFIDLDLLVVGPAGQTVYKDTYKNDIGGYDVFSGITDLVPFTQKMLDIAVDTMLDKPEFRSSMSRPGRSTVMPSS